MSNIIRKNLHIALLIAIIIGLTGYMVFWGMQKSGLHSDELFTLMDIRGAGLDRPFNIPDETLNTWFEASEFVGLQGVAEENAFAFGLRRSYIPAFVLLHIAYSFYPGVFTIWPAVILNILIFIASLIVLYNLGRLLIKDKYLALLPCLLWGVSSASINLVVFIRHYMLFAFLSILLIYLVFIAINSSFKKWWHIPLILLTVILGIFNHPYFLIFAFFVALPTFIYLLIKREYMPLLKFSLPMLAGVAYYEYRSGFISAIVRGVAGGGMEHASHQDQFAIAIDGFIGGQASPHRSHGFIEMMERFSETVFGVPFVVLMIVVAVLIIIVCVFQLNTKDKAVEFLKKRETALGLIIGIASIAYLALISRIAPWVCYRYISNASPFVMLLIVSLAIFAVKSIGFRSSRNIFAIISIPLVVLLLLNVADWFIFRDRRTGEELAPYHHLPVVFIETGFLEPWHMGVHSELLYFENKVMIATDESLMAELFEGKDFDDGIVIIMHEDGRRSDFRVLSEIVNAAGLTRNTLISRDASHIDDTYVAYLWE